MRLVAAWALAGLLACGAPPEAVAQERAAIGNGRLFSNDILGDGKDRWRTGSYVFSHLRAPRPWDGAGQGFADLLEYRLRAEIIAPGALRSGRPDRPSVGALSFGVFTHANFGYADTTLGGEVTVIGPQTGLADFQRGFHDTFGLRAPLIAGEIGDDVLFTSMGEVRTTLHPAPGATIRPFIAAQAGAEDLLRAGGDVIVGPVAQTDLMLRDPVTGQLYRGTRSPGTGLAVVLGGDVAAVGDSRYLPGEQGYATAAWRSRARAGVHVQLGEGVTFFYGATYLGEEFAGQREGQVLGSLRLNFNF